MRDIYAEFIEESLDKYNWILKKKLSTRKIYPKEYNKYFRKLIEWDDTFIERFNVVFSEDLKEIDK